MPTWLDSEERLNKTVSKRAAASWYAPRARAAVSVLVRARSVGFCPSQCCFRRTLAHFDPLCGREDCHLVPQALQQAELLVDDVPNYMFISKDWCGIWASS